MGFTEFLCRRADRVVRRKGLMDRPNTDIIRTEYREEKNKERRIAGMGVVCEAIATIIIFPRQFGFSVCYIISRGLRSKLLSRDDKIRTR